MKNVINEGKKQIFKLKIYIPKRIISMLNIIYTVYSGIYYTNQTYLLKARNFI